ncbi:MAG: DUF5677 domain-containing protein [Elusimicrobiota bacterium]
MKNNIELFEDFIIKLKLNCFVKNSTPENIKKYHGRVVGFSRYINLVSKLKDKYIKNNRLSRGAFFKLHAWQIVLHKAILSLCEEGWAQTSGILSRTMLDTMATMLVIGEKEHEYRAFKYYAFEDLKIINSGSVSDDERSKIEDNLEITIKELTPEDRSKVKDYIEGKKYGNYWFCPDYTNINSVFDKLTEKESDLYFKYRLYSGVSHGSHVGTNIGLDQPDTIGIDPQPNKESSKRAIYDSSRLLLETCLIRNEFEKLGQRDVYYYLLEEYLKFKDS